MLKPKIQKKQNTNYYLTKSLPTMVTIYVAPTNNIDNSNNNNSTNNINDTNTKNVDLLYLLKRITFRHLGLCLLGLFCSIASFIVAVVRGYNAAICMFTVIQALLFIVLPV